jgi:hypothetical protein
MEIGDKVRFVDEVGGGTVLRIEGKMVVVNDANGFEIPTPIAKVLVVNARESTNFPVGQVATSAAPKPAPAPAAKPVAKAVELEIETAAAPDVEHDAAGNSYELMLAFLPPQNEQTELYLLNDSPYRLLYNVGQYERSGLVAPLAQGLMAGDSKQLLATLPMSNLRMQQTLRVEVLLYKNVPFGPQSVEPVNVELKPIKIFSQGAYVENDFFDEHALILRVLSHVDEDESSEPLNADALRDSLLSGGTTTASQPATKHPDVEEVNLHAEVLVPLPAKLQPSELLGIQLEHFERTLNNAIASGRKGKMVFIHGLGSGTLKQEIRSRVEKNYPQLSYQDASFKEYGYGATMVII